MIDKVAVCDYVYGIEVKSIACGRGVSVRNKVYVLFITGLRMICGVTRVYRILYSFAHSLLAYTI